MELLLIRHALPIRRENVDGAADPVLSDLGHAQAAHLADYLAVETIHALYASPMQRARQTAAPVGERLGLPVVIEDGVAEYDRNSDTYIPVEELKATNHPMWQEMLTGSGFGGDIDPADFQELVVSSIERLIAAHPRQTIAIVCHGGVINAYLSRILGLADPTGFFYPNYTSIHRVVAARTGERTIKTINETTHLRGTGLPVGING